MSAEREDDRRRLSVMQILEGTDMRNGARIAKRLSFRVDIPPVCSWHRCVSVVSVLMSPRCYFGYQQHEAVAAAGETSRELLCPQIQIKQ